MKGLHQDVNDHFLFEEPLPPKKFFAALLSDLQDSMPEVAVIFAEDIRMEPNTQLPSVKIATESLGSLPDEITQSMEILTETNRMEVRFFDEFDYEVSVLSQDKNPQTGAEFLSGAKPLLESLKRVLDKQKIAFKIADDGHQILSLI